MWTLNFGFDIVVNLWESYKNSTNCHILFTQSSCDLLLQSKHCKKQWLKKKKKSCILISQTWPLAGVRGKAWLCLVQHQQRSWLEPLEQDGSLTGKSALLGDQCSASAEAPARGASPHRLSDGLLELPQSTAAGVQKWAGRRRRQELYCLLPSSPPKFKWGGENTPSS